MIVMAAGWAVSRRLSLLELAGLAGVTASVWFLWRPAAALLVAGVFAVLAAAALEWTGKRGPR